MACQAGSSPPVIIDHQMDSRFYRLPQELRDQVYGHLCASTRLSRGLRHTTRVRPDPHALAILRTCRRARHELGDTWIGRVTFHFEGPADMLDMLTTLPPRTTPLLSRIRRVRVGARKLELGFPGGGKFRACYGLASALKLLPPGLDLDVLTVLGSGDGGAGSSSSSSLRHDYETLDELVRHGSGWRELRFVSPGSALLGYANAMPSFLVDDDEDDDGDEDGAGGRKRCRFWRRPQPDHWRSALLDRDGEASEPEVAIYRSAKLGRGCGSGIRGVLDERTRETYEQEVPQGRLAMEDFGIWGDKVLLADGEREKEMMIVVKRGGRRGRGRGAGAGLVDCAEKEGEGSPFIPGDIRQEMGGMSWEAIRRDHIDALDEMRVVEDGVETDSYVDVDDYVWPTIPPQPTMNIYAGI